MAKKRRAPLRLAATSEGEEENADEEEVDDGRPRPAPNTTFLGRLVRGVATGNQRQMHTTTTNAANLSIGATGAASMRLQLQRTANAHTARYQTLRRVVLSSAAQQRLTLCTALLAEVAQGFGFRLTVRQPDGEEVGAHQAMAAASALDEQQRASAAKASAAAATATAGVAAAAAHDQVSDEDAAQEHRPREMKRARTAEEEAVLEGEEDQAADGQAVGGIMEALEPDGSVGRCRGGSGAAAAVDFDPMNALDPLFVDLDLDLDASGMLLQMLPARQPSSPVARLAKSTATLQARRTSIRSGLLSGRLTSATLGSMGLMRPKKNTVAAQAVLAARRRALMRSASNGATQEAAGAAAAAVADDDVKGAEKATDDDATAAAVPSGADAVNTEPRDASASPLNAAPDVAAADERPTGAGSMAPAGGGSTVCATPAPSAANPASSRRIVWDPTKLPKAAPTSVAAPLVTSSISPGDGSAAGTAAGGGTPGPPLLKRPRASLGPTAAAAAVSTGGTAPVEREVKDNCDIGGAEGTQEAVLGAIEGQGVASAAKDHCDTGGGRLGGAGRSRIGGAVGAAATAGLAGGVAGDAARQEATPEPGGDGDVGASSSLEGEQHDVSEDGAEGNAQEGAPRTAGRGGVGVGGRLAGARVGAGIEAEGGGGPAVGASGREGVTGARGEGGGAGGKRSAGAGRGGGVGMLGSPAGKLFGAAMRQLQRRSMN